MHPESDIPGEVFCNAMLAHAIMPSLAELTAAQKADPKLQAVRKCICKKPSDRDETELPVEYKQHAQYVQLHDDAMYYRDIQNDEWMTSAVMLPEAMEQTALEAYHDSAYD